MQAKIYIAHFVLIFIYVCNNKYARALHNALYQLNLAPFPNDDKLIECCLLRKDFSIWFGRL